MNILLSNDDGVYAPGLCALTKEVAKFAKTTVVAPDRNRSGASNSLTLQRPLRIHCLENGYYYVDGTPTDCVHLALTGFLKEPMDMVVSGINEGANLGDDVLYSGTVAAAIEGRSLGFPALAFSLVGEGIQSYETAANIAGLLIKTLSEETFPSQTIFNINIPNLPLAQIRGIQITRLGTRHLAEPTIPSRDPKGKPVYWIGPPGKAQDAGPGTDFHAIQENCVSITPLHIDMTNYRIFDTLSHCIKGIAW